nr:MAG TPA: hypothetical protein [Caudoviricetes sp.]
MPMGVANVQSLGAHIATKSRSGLCARSLLYACTGDGTG